jgi:sugar transferase EpsL
MTRKQTTAVRRATKRALDLLVAVPAILLISPVLAVLAVLVRVRLGHPILFRQHRPGLHGRPFTIYKFRTMRDARGPDGRPLPDSERVTRLGRFLRRTSLDELPELYNVVRGDMSLVGPRPLLMQYLSRYTPEQKRRHDMKPGITGPTQVYGRNALTWDEKFALDLWYVDHHSLLLDGRLLLLTIWEVLKGAGITPLDTDDVPEFMGDDSHRQAVSTSARKPDA